MAHTSSHKILYC